MTPSDDENIYENITNNNGLNDDSSLNELQDLAIEINDSEIKIDIDDSQIPLKNDDLYQIDTTSNNETDTLYHEQLPYENTQDIATVDYNNIPNEETEISVQSEIIDENNEPIQQNEMSFEYSDNNNEINEQISYESDSAYVPINEPVINTPDEQQNSIEGIEEPQEEEYVPSIEETTYSSNYQDEYNQEYQEIQNPQPKRNIIPILMAIFAIVIFFAVLNLPQVKEKINGIKSNDVENETISELNELSNLDKQSNDQNIQNKENTSNKRAKMVVFDEEEKETGSDNVKICANPFLPTMNVGDRQDNSLGAYEIIVPPSGNEMENSVEVSTMMETKVSGILYDKDNPQAILNYNDQDQLVSRGDRLAGFYVMSITPDKVILKQGNNVYRVSVGQTVTDEGINYNVNSNLGKQFGGRYKNIKGKIINMNNDQEK